MITPAGRFQAASLPCGACCVSLPAYCTNPRQLKPFACPCLAGVSAAGQPPPSPMDGFMRLPRGRGKQRARASEGGRTAAAKPHGWVHASPARQGQAKGEGERRRQDSRRQAPWMGSCVSREAGASKGRGRAKAAGQPPPSPMDGFMRLPRGQGQAKGEGERRRRHSRAYSAARLCAPAGKRPAGTRHACFASGVGGGFGVGIDAAGFGRQVREDELVAVEAFHAGGAHAGTAQA